MSTTLDPRDFIRRVAGDAARAHFSDYPRPLGADGPHVGDVIAIQRDAAPECASVELDLSHDATPATDDLRNALMILAAAHDSMIGDAVKQLMQSALRKIEAR